MGLQFPSLRGQFFVTGVKIGGGVKSIPEGGCIFLEKGVLILARMGAPPLSTCDVLVMVSG